MINDEYIKKHKLLECLQEFKGATKTGNSAKEREKSLEEPFTLLAKKFIYGGYIQVRDEYKIYIHTVEFYYHEEEGMKGIKIEDDIVYHKNDKFNGRDVPYFPLMTLHHHWSGFDITFENEAEGMKYRASALIRKYAVFDIKAGKYVRWIKTANDEKYEKNDRPIWDNRSSYLQYYLNGFALDNRNSGIEWKDDDKDGYGEVIPDYRKNVDRERKWAFKKK